jgi:hypothetical protein
MVGAGLPGHGMSYVPDGVVAAGPEKSGDAVWVGMSFG